MLRNANLVENYPGFPDGISGGDLAALFRRQLDRLGVEVTEVSATSIRRGKRGFEVRAGGRTYEADAVILATGTRPRRLGIRGEQRLHGRRLFYSVVEMPAGDVKPGRTVIIGGGDAAFDYALNLHGMGHRVTIVSRSEPRCLGLLKERVREAGIDVMTGVDVRSVTERIGGLALACDASGVATSLACDYVLVACGRDPETDLLDVQSSLKPRLKAGGPETNIEGLYLVGDVIRGSHRQAGIAVGDGVRAAMMADALARRRRGRG